MVEKVRINVWITKEQKRQLEEKSAETGASQAGLVCLAIEEYLGNRRVMKELPAMMAMMQMIPQMSTGIKQEESSAMMNAIKAKLNESPKQENSSAMMNAIREKMKVE